MVNIFFRYGRLMQAVCRLQNANKHPVSLPNNFFSGTSLNKSFYLRYETPLFSLAPPPGYLLYPLAKRF